MKSTLLVSASLLLLLLFSCLPPTAATAGALTISFSPTGVANRTILPDTDMNIASYAVTGAGPAGASFSVETSQTSVVVGSLAFGDWTVTVEAKNGDGVVIANGTGTTTVHTGQSSSVAVSVRPLDGVGVLDLAVTWNAADTELPAIDAQLVPVTGEARTLDFTITNGNTGTFHAEDVATGYHTLIVKLLDNGQLAMGAVEVVRIVDGGTSAGSFDFPEINKPGGSVIVTLTPEMADPLTVSIDGAVSMLALGQSMTVTANTAEAVDNVVYVWYLNGESVGTGNTFTFGSSLGIGVYRLDVTAVTADGTRAGSAGLTFNVWSGVS